MKLLKYSYFIVSSKKLSPKTLQAYTINLMQFAVYEKISKDKSNFKSMSKETLNNYLQKISFHKSKTIKHKVASLKAMLHYTEYEDDDYTNPFRKI